MTVRRAARVGAWLACLSAAGAAPARRPVVLVADVGIDDAAAVLLLLRDPTLELLGVAASFGCHGDVRRTAANARRLLDAAGAGCVPVHVGSRFPLADWATPVDDGAYIHGTDGLGDVAPSPAERDAAATGRCFAAPDERLSAAEFIVAAARARPGEITIVATSPLTNLALAVLLEPALPSLVKGAYVMGGAVHHPGNVSPLAEANFAHDARAAKIVVEAFATADAAKLVIAPLDVTMRAMVKNSALAALSNAGPAASLFAAAWKAYTANYCQVLKFCGDHGALHDVHPVAFLIWPELYTQVERMSLDVVVATPLNPANGHSLLDRRQLSKQGVVDDRTGEVVGQTRPAATVLLDVDADAFIAKFLAALAPNATV